MAPSMIFSSKNLMNQRFALPPTIISYICKDSKPDPKVLLNLYFSCKYFWSKIQVASVYGLSIDDKEASFTTAKHDYDPMPNILNLEFKLLIINRLAQDTKKDFYLISKLILKGWRFEMESCSITRQILTLNEYKLITEYAEGVYLAGVKIIKTAEDTCLVPLNEIILVGEKIHSFIFWPFEEDSKSIYSKEAFDKLWKVNKKFSHFQLENVPSNINPISFGKFIKTNAKSVSQFCFHYQENVTEKWKKVFEKLLHNQLKNWDIYECSVFTHHLEGLIVLIDFEKPEDDSEEADDEENDED